MEELEVIDLLSSPEPTIPEKKRLSDSTSSRPTATSKSPKRIALHTSGAEQKEPGKDANEWFYISDDPDHDHRLSVPRTLNPTQHPCDQMGSPPCLNLHGAYGKAVTTSSTSVFKSLSPVAMHMDKGKGRACADGDFFILSDDVDVSVNINNPSLSDPFQVSFEPNAKRRRITPEPPRVGSNKFTHLAFEKRIGLSRSVSDITADSGGRSIGTSKTVGLRRSKTSITDDDPIVFSSSPDLVRVAKDRRKRQQRMNALDKDYDDDPFRTDGHRIMASDVTREMYEDDSRPSSSDLDLPDIGAITASQTFSYPSLCNRDSKRTLTAYQVEKVILQKKRDRALKAQEKLNLKEEDKERKRLAREAKAKGKEMAADLAKVNTLRIDKKISTPEMIVDLPMDLDTRLATQVRQFLEPLEVQCMEWNSYVPNVIKWRRKVESVYNEEMGHWEPAPKQIKPEKLVMCIMTANEFVELAIGEEGRDLDAHILRMKAHFFECDIIYLIEGLTIWMRKNRNVKNRQFTDAVRRQMDRGIEETATSASQRQKKSKQHQEYVDEDMVEDTLLKLQVIHCTTIHHTASTVDTAQWVMVFTQHISTMPYRHQRMNLDTAFCMESGQVRTGHDAPDTFIKMLQEVNRVTAPIAYGIAAAYPSVQKLVQAFEKDGKDVLQGLRKCANRDGAFTDREIGKSISRRLWVIFMGLDPGSFDV